MKKMSGHSLLGITGSNISHYGKISSAEVSAQQRPIIGGVNTR
jgi:hypothetical protein